MPNRSARRSACVPLPAPGAPIRSRRIWLPSLTVSPPRVRQVITGPMTTSSDESQPHPGASRQWFKRVPNGCELPVTLRPPGELGSIRGTRGRTRERNRAHCGRAGLDGPPGAYRQPGRDDLADKLSVPAPVLGARLARTSPERRRGPARRAAGGPAARGLASASAAGSHPATGTGPRRPSLAVLAVTVVRRSGTRFRQRPAERRRADPSPAPGPSTGARGPGR